MFFRKKEALSKEEQNIIDKLTKFYVQNSNILNSYLKDSMSQKEKRIIIKKIYDILDYSINPKLKSTLEKENNNTIKVYRGISASDKDELKKYIEQFIKDDMFLGGRASLYGSGIYTCCDTSTSVAESYATDGNSNSNGIVIEIEIPSDTNLVTYDNISQIQEKIISVLRDKYADHEKFQQYLEIISNTGAFGAVLGIDAIYVEQKEYIVILNRGNMIVNDIEIYKNEIYQKSDLEIINNKTY